ncbi:MAG: DsbA family protein [Candidatus Midichloria sp.]|nr:MAG: DsbA family protein [Candidatus Midichloria sp.]
MHFIQIIIYCSLLFSTLAFASTDHTTNEKAELLKINSNDKFLGNKNAKIVLIEYSSLACPHCADFHISILPKIKEHYIDKDLLVYVHRNFPTNKPSLIAAMLASCSNNYFPFLNGLFLSQESWGYSVNFEKLLCNIAKLSSMEKSDFDKCLQDKELKDSMYNEAFKASKILEINATPVFFLNGERIEGAVSYDSLATKINSRIKLYNTISNQ